MEALDPIARTVLNILNRFGGTCKVISSVQGEYNVETSTVQVINVEYVVKMIAFDYIQKFDGNRSQTNMLIRDGDKQLFIKLNNGQPLPNPSTDSIIYKNIKYSIITIKDLNPSGTKSLMVELFIRE